MSTVIFQSMDSLNIVVIMQKRNKMAYNLLSKWHLFVVLNLDLFFVSAGSGKYDKVDLDLIWARILSCRESR